MSCRRLGMVGEQKTSDFVSGRREARMTMHDTISKIVSASDRLQVNPRALCRGCCSLEADAVDLGIRLAL